MAGLYERKSYQSGSKIMNVYYLSNGIYSVHTGNIEGSYSKTEQLSEEQISMRLVRQKYNYVGEIAK